MDNGFKIWHWDGTAMHEEKFDEIHQVRVLFFQYSSLVTFTSLLLSSFLPLSSALFSPFLSLLPSFSCRCAGGLPRPSFIPIFLPRGLQAIVSRNGRNRTKINHKYANETDMLLSVDDRPSFDACRFHRREERLRRAQQENTFRRR